MLLDGSHQLTDTYLPVLAVFAVCLIDGTIRLFSCAYWQKLVRDLSNKALACGIRIVVDPSQPPLSMRDRPSFLGAMQAPVQLQWEVRKLSPRYSTPVRRLLLLSHQGLAEQELVHGSRLATRQLVDICRLARWRSRDGLTVEWTDGSMRR
jgi:hypothetical protein